LLQRFLLHLTGTYLANKEDTEPEEASAGCDFSLHATRGGLQDSFCGSHVGACGNVLTAIFYLLRHVEALSSEEPEAILDYITKLD